MGDNVNTSVKLGKKISMRTFLSLAFVIAIFLQVSAQLKVARIFSDNMIIQRDEPIVVWGWHQPGKSVKVEFAGKESSASADGNGQWKLEFSPMSKGGPYTMRITGGGTKEFSNIYLGDIWVCSGQSNMEWPVRITNNAEQEIANADFPMIRSFTVAKTTALKPQSDLNEGQWEICSPETVGDFTAVGYYFAREVYQQTEVPIGLLHTSWGGTNVETWIPLWKLKELPEYESSVELLDKSSDLRKLLDDLADQLLKKIGDLPEEDPGLRGEEAIWANLSSYDSWENTDVPGHWEWRGLQSFDGIVWFQRYFDLDPSEAGNPLEIHLGAIDDSDKTYVNGKLVGGLEMAYNEDRIYRVSPGVLKSGKNSLVVRIEDVGGGGGFSGPLEELFIKTSKRTIRINGDWSRKVGTGIVAVNESPNDFPTQLYNTMIHPIIDLPVRGTIWYQGESNAWNARQYASSFPAMIQSWRTAWNQEDMPFYFVQLANFMEANDEPVEAEWAELREAQTQTLSLPNTGMALAIDIGEADDIHPRNKQDVGKRLALIALNQDYGKENLVYSGPKYSGHIVEKNKMVITFDHIGSGLVVKNRYGYLNGFAIAGDDKKFFWAKAEIQGNKVVVWSEQVTNPKAVRYGWSSNPHDINLYNQEGLPAIPFRTDNWPGVTDDARYEPGVKLD